MSNRSSIEVTIMNSLGLHARPAAMFVQAASKYEKVKVSVGRDNEELVDGKSIMGLMMLAAAQGTVLKIQVEGPDSGDVAKELGDLIQNRFGEE
jgi:phosphocarrier protein